MVDLFILHRVALRRRHVHCSRTSTGCARVLVGFILAASRSQINCSSAFLIKGGDSSAAAFVKKKKMRRTCVLISVTLAVWMNHTCRGPQTKQNTNTVQYTHTHTHTHTQTHTHTSNKRQPQSIPDRPGCFFYSDVF